MITNEHLKTALGTKFDPTRTYVVAEKGPTVASKINKGYEKVGTLDDDLTAVGTDMLILMAPLPPPPPVPRVKPEPKPPAPPPRPTATRAPRPPAPKPPPTPPARKFGRGGLKPTSKGGNKK